MEEDKRQSERFQHDRKIIQSHPKQRETRMTESLLWDGILEGPRLSLFHSSHFKNHIFILPPFRSEPIMSPQGSTKQECYQTRKLWIAAMRLILTPSSQTHSSKTQFLWRGSRSEEFFPMRREESERRQFSGEANPAVWLPIFFLIQKWECLRFKVSSHRWSVS